MNDFRRLEYRRTVTRSEEHNLQRADSAIVEGIARERRARVMYAAFAEAVDGLIVVVLLD